jgi:hypothetical protein
VPCTRFRIILTTIFPLPEPGTFPQCN